MGKVLSFLFYIFNSKIMSKTPQHKRLQSQAAGKAGKTEAKLPGKRLLDALTKSGKRATEVERSGQRIALEKAAGRLKASGAKQRILQVPQTDLTKGVKAMRRIKVSGTVKNMSGTKRRSV